MKVLIILIILLILGTLVSAFIAMMKGGDTHSPKLYKSLRLRIVLTVGMMMFVLLAISMGWIEPNRVVLDKPV